MKYIDFENGNSWKQCLGNFSKRFALIDVREPVEFAEYHLPGSLNMPSSRIRLEEFEEFSSKEICLICTSGVRAKAVAKKLDLLGFNNVYVANKQLNEMNTAFFENETQQDESKAKWSVDRQFRLTLGLLLAIYLLLFYLEVETSIVVPGILAVGLIWTSLINRSFLCAAIGMLPWNR